MPYQSSNHKNNQNNNRPTSENQQMNRGQDNFSRDASLVKRKGYNNNGYKNVNNYNSQNTNLSQMQETLKKVKEKQKKHAAKKAIVEGMNAVAPVVGGAAAEAALKTEQGKELLDAYAKGDTPAEGIKNVKEVLDRKRRMIKLIGLVLALLLPILIIVILVTVIFKNADSQIFSNENGGTVESENYGSDDPYVNIFANYPGLYEKIEKNVQEVSEHYKLEIDKYLIAATLVAPIENGLIIPVTDGSCGEEECYYFNDESLTWTEFLDSWGDQSELLAKMQILTYVNPASNINVSCGEEETMEQYAQNDKEIHTFSWWGWLNPLNWFKGFTDAVEAETNAKCIDVPSYRQYKVPTIYTISTEQGEYYLSNDASGNYDYIKDPNTGGVYFWNLINKNGFIHEYLKDYLSAEYKDDPDKNYEINKKTIVDTVNYIYSYYESIRKDCYGNKILESTIENINIYNPPEKQSRFGIPENQSIDFEDQYIGGVLLAEYNSGDLESLKAFAILARSEAIAIVGMDGSGTIENSSNDQNYNPEYSPEKYPKIAEAVEATRGMVLSRFQEPKVWHTEYDAFCPVKNTLENGFYYLDEEQQSLPINPAAYEAITGKIFIEPDSKWLDCPCFKNSHSRPHDEDADDESTRYYTSSTNPPTYPGGTPSQETKEVCWTYKGPVTASDGSSKFAWKYKPSGGHGRGASQYGLKYFEAFGYDRDALLRMFFEGGVVRVLSSSLPEGVCSNIPYYTGERQSSSTGNSSGSGTGNSSGGGGASSATSYTGVIGGTALNKPLTEALADNGYTVSDLNNCIGTRVNNAGYGTRDGVVQAGIGLLECTMQMTGGYTYPYDHRGGYVGGGYNPDIQGKLGVNSKWGEYADYATGCSSDHCRLGLNCANFVRWSMCNGGMDLCSRGSTYATGMAGYNSSEDYFPGATRVKLTPSFSILSGSISVSSKEEAINMIKPGDVLYSDNNGGGNHVMLIVGVDSSSITIAENGRKTRKISKSELSSSSMTYVVLLLDNYYANSANVNSLSW